MVKAVQGLGHPMGQPLGPTDGTRPFKFQGRKIGFYDHSLNEKKSTKVEKKIIW